MKRIITIITVLAAFLLLAFMSWLDHGYDVERDVAAEKQSALLAAKRAAIREKLCAHRQKFCD